MMLAVWTVYAAGINVQNADCPYSLIAIMRHNVVIDEEIEPAARPFLRFSSRNCSLSPQEAEHVASAIS